MAARLTLDELADSAGLDLGRSSGVTIGQADVDTFARLSGDQQWIHVDPERAEREGLPGTIVHGFLTLSLVGRFWGELLEVSGASQALNYGLDRVRFLGRVPVGSTISMTATIASVERRPDGVKVATDIALFADDGEAPVAVATSLVLFLN
jgi:acyl dehydratase